MKTQINMKPYAIIAILMAMLSCHGFAQDGKTPTITKTFELNQPGTLNSKSTVGGIVVKTHNESKVEVQVFIQRNYKVLSPSDSLVADILKKNDLEIEKNGSVINVNAEHENNFSLIGHFAFKLIIFVPREMSCNVS